MTTKTCAVPFHGSRLRELRVTLGLTQRDLSGRCGLSVDRIKLLEWGWRKPAGRQVKALCAALNVSPGAFALPATRSRSDLFSCLARQAGWRRRRAKQLAAEAERSQHRQSKSQG